MPPKGVQRKLSAEQVGGEEIIRSPRPFLPSLDHRCSQPSEGEGRCTQIPKPPRTCPAGSQPRDFPIAQRMLCTPAPPGGLRESDPACISTPGSLETTYHFKIADASSRRGLKSGNSGQASQLLKETDENH